jgi:hypothetical protein
MHGHPGLDLIHGVGNEDFNAEGRFPALQEEHVRTQAGGRLPLHRDLIEIKVAKVKPSLFHAGAVQPFRSVASSTPAGCQHFRQPGIAVPEKP